MILDHFGVHKGGGSIKPTAPVMYMDSLRMFKGFFFFLVSFSGVYNNNDNRICLQWKLKYDQSIPN